MNRATINVQLDKYIHKIKPLSIEKERRNTAGDRCTPREHSQLHAIVGARQWPAAQATIHASASVSLAHARGAESTVMDLLEANKTRSASEEQCGHTAQVCSPRPVESSARWPLHGCIMGVPAG